MMGMGYDLMQGEGCLGNLQPSDLGQPWVYSMCTPSAEFESVMTLFEDEVALLNSHEEDWDAWEKAYQRIEDLGLRLVPQDGGPAIEEFLLHIDGDVACF